MRRIRPINPATLNLTPTAAHLEAPSPILFNAYKHHAGILRQRIQQTVAAGPAGLDDFARELVVLGTELMDLYHGRCTPTEVGEQVLVRLSADQRFAFPEFRDWISAGGGYQVIELPVDQSRWVLRLGEEGGRYVHLHPGRWSPQTCRVRANVLKTALLVLADVGLHGGEPLALPRVNAVRQRYLGLAPLGRDLSGNQGIGEIIGLLQT
ncbi:MAG: hypothetical protein JNM56_13210 [Planctomycetia bacterium]|nr:hypothetical protein [Planctomycetia bacterium]